MRYCQISKEMALLYFGLAVFSRIEARVPEFDTHPPPLYGPYIICTLYTAQYTVYSEHCFIF
jgi:hypothetical protein